MKVGILTFHRALNYGAVLQCYALQESIKSLGYETYVIDYIQPYIEQIYKLHGIRKFISGIPFPKGINSTIDRIKGRALSKERFESFRSKYLSLIHEPQNKIPQAIDTYVIGSDQLWSCNCYGGSIDPIFFGNFNKRLSSKVIGYAISTMDGSLESVGKDNLKRYISNFNALSLREQKYKERLESLIGVSAHVDLDPTLLVNETVWEKIVNENWSKKRPYIVLYYVSRDVDYDFYGELKQKAFKVAKDNDWDIIDLTSQTYSVEDYVSAFKFAKCVITTAFHAVAFSVIFERPLCAVMLRDGEDGRSENLLNAIGLEAAMVTRDFKLKIPQLNYKQAKEKLLQMRSESMKYLQDNL